MVTYRIQGPSHWTPLDVREIFSRVAAELGRDETYGWAAYERDPKGPALCVRRALTAQHKANIEACYNCILENEK